MAPYEVAIIGGGPAGLTAGIYAARAELNTVLFERAMPGGLAASTEFIENYPGFSEGIGGPELTAQMEAQARRFGLEIRNNNIESIKQENGLFVLDTDDGPVNARAVILATGAQPQRLNVPGEETYHGRGVSYCATCDGAFFRNKQVAVVGGGDAAVEEAMFLTRFASRVYIIHRRGELRATRIVQTRARQNPRIEFIWHSVVEEILGDTGVTGVRIKDVRTGDTRRVPVDGIFIYVGFHPASNLVKGLVELDERGYVIADDQMRTSCPGLFAAGDVRKKSLRQVVTAVADGAIAAVSAERYLAENR
ncbi:thioredoxin-disulfide reductase [Desulfofundulus thermobenzoicus]|uniref:Thioredoxin reductase n=1 Tax=Desulfofundulus thermobenzoicus TaxID=29376 RepID=A0A6N7IW41_9FIRM|nr:thioredoxin-disulfide reductase [Desulfofundulus thermobenzoicus]MQL53813.1 thioredoxin-disulfide reductase [Desulfofundulus thermobenzoicus]HHW43352.1 thioredoxin-disulfide reductase [Desulfotomaculum sp.]